MPNVINAPRANHTTSLGRFHAAHVHKIKNVALIIVLTTFNNAAPSPSGVKTPWEYANMAAGTINTPNKPNIVQIVFNILFFILANYILDRFHIIGIVPRRSIV